MRFDDDNQKIFDCIIYCLFFVLVMLLLASFISCSTLAPIAGGALGGGAGALVSPVGGAIGAGIGVTTAQVAFPNESSQPVDGATALALAQSGKPLAGTTASTIHETKNLVFELGWMYLLIFVLVPFVTKRGRGWIKGIANARHSVSGEQLEERIRKLQEEIDTKK